jgi:hypothetical protein
MTDNCEQIVASKYLISGSIILFIYGYVTMLSIVKNLMASKDNVVNKQLIRTAFLV